MAALRLNAIGGSHWDAHHLGLVPCGSPSSTPDAPSRSARWCARREALPFDDFIYPLFAVEGERVRTPIGSMPGVFNLSVDELVREAGGEWWRWALYPSVILFGIPGSKDARGYSSLCRGRDRSAGDPGAQASPSRRWSLLADVCLCEYTAHGHCGVLDPHGEVQNDPSTLPLLARMALTCAQAGADVIAPSDMMDGRVGGDPGRASTRAASSTDADPQLCRQVRLGILRSLP